MTFARLMARIGRSRRAGEVEDLFYRAPRRKGQLMQYASSSSGRVSRPRRLSRAPPGYFVDVGRMTARVQHSVLIRGGARWQGLRIEPTRAVCARRRQAAAPIESSACIAARNGASNFLQGHGADRCSAAWCRPMRRRGRDGALSATTTAPPTQVDRGWRSAGETLLRAPGGPRGSPYQHRYRGRRGPRPAVA